MLRLFLVFTLLFAQVGSTAGAQTIDLSTRTFWLGETPDTLNSFPPFIAVRKIGWIEEVLQHDPALKDAVFFIEQAFYSVHERNLRPPEDQIRLHGSRLPNEFVNPDFIIYGSPTVTSPGFTYMPVNQSFAFSVSCGERRDTNTILPNRGFSLCVVYASYEPDDAIVLKARLFFPPNPIDAPDYFRAVAERMREIAGCLDVTEISQIFLNEPPAIQDCGLIIGS